MNSGSINGKENEQEMEYRKGDMQGHRRKWKIQSHVIILGGEIIVLKLGLQQ